jgi:hypothetical protein
MARKAFLLVKHKPTIFIVMGGIGLFAAGVYTYRSVLKIDSILDDAQDKLQRIKDGNNGQENYTSIDAQKDTTTVYVQTAVKVTKAVLPAAALAIASGCLIFKGHRIFKTQITGLIAAYNILDRDYKDYRRRVVDDYGPERDKELKTGIHKELVTGAETGEDRSIVKQIKSIDPYKTQSPFGKWFGKGNKLWHKSPAYNILFLKCQQQFANDLLQSRESHHVFLNEVYESLNLPHTPEGAVCGWILDGEGDGYISFGLSSLDVDEYDMMNYESEDFYLDFNVDGVIWDKI